MRAAALFLMLLSTMCSTSTAQQASTSATTISSGCLCGKSSVAKIVGGQAAIPGEFPWQAALVRTGSTLPFCGGSLISSRTVLTAAHCNVYSVNSFSVILGGHDLTNPPTGQKSYVPTSFVNHPNYNKTTEENDLAIITLSTDVVFSTTILPVCLPLGTGSDYDNKLSTITGWGTLTSGGNQPNVLQKANVTTMTNAACSSSPYLYTSAIILPVMICAASPGKDTCQGDSGGPMITLASSNNSYELIGVTSFGYGGCANASFPGVYARVTSARSWINSLTTGTVCPPPSSASPTSSSTTAASTTASTASAQASTTTSQLTCPPCNSVLSGTFKGTYFFSTNSDSRCPGGCIYLSSTNSSAQFCFTDGGLEQVANCA